MVQNVIDYVKEKGIKLSPSSKAQKLINQGADEAAIAVALQTTKAYKEDAELRKLCQKAVENAGKKQADENKKEERRSSTNRYGECERK